MPCSTVPDWSGLCCEQYLTHPRTCSLSCPVRLHLLAYVALLQGAVWSCALDPTATLAATASADFSAKLWDALTGLEKATLQHKHIVRTCCFSPCSGKLVTGGYEKLLRLYEVERPEAAPRELTGAPAAVRATVFVGPSDSLLVSSVNDTPGLTVWDVRGGNVVRTLATEGPVTSVDVSGGRAGGWGWFSRCECGRCRQRVVLRRCACKPCSKGKGFHFGTLRTQ